MERHRRRCPRRRATLRDCPPDAITGRFGHSCRSRSKGPEWNKPLKARLIGVKRSHRPRGSQRAGWTAGAAIISGESASRARTSSRQRASVNQYSGWSIPAADSAAPPRAARRSSPVSSNLRGVTRRVFSRSPSSPRRRWRTLGRNHPRGPRPGLRHPSSFGQHGTALALVGVFDLHRRQPGWCRQAQQGVGFRTRGGCPSSKIFSTRASSWIW